MTVAKLGNKSFLILLVAVLFFTHCKKEPAFVIEKIAPTFNLNFYVELDLIKKQTNDFDTTLYFYTRFSRHFDKPSPSDSYLNANVSLNTINLNNYFTQPTNVLGFITPAHWQANSAELGNVDYTDMSAMPSFTNANWWNVDSINASQNFVIDFSSFKDYSQIYVDYNATQPSFMINYPTNQITIPANTLSSYLRQQTLNVWVYNSTKTNTGNKTLYFNKSLHFEIHTIAY